MPTSNTEPKTINLDFVRNGIAYILVHWDIESIEQETDLNPSTILYKYQECKLKWTLPKSYSTKSGVISYLNSVENEILEWAKGSKVTL